MPLVEQRGADVLFAVKVHPKARRERITEVLGDALKLDIVAPPVQGKANDACIRYFAELLKVPRSSVTIAAGITNRNKVIRISGVRAAAVEQVFQTLLNR